MPGGGYVREPQRKENSSRVVTPPRHGSYGRAIAFWILPSCATGCLDVSITYGKGRENISFTLHDTMMPADPKTLSPANNRVMGSRMSSFP